MSSSFKVRFLNIFRNIFKLRLFETMLVKMTAHRSTDHLFCKLAPNPYQYKSPSYRTFILDGVKLTADISDYIGHYYYFGFQDKSHRKLFDLCRQDYNIIDVGANIGFTTLKMAQIANNGNVIGFEPDPLNYSRCVVNFNQNSLPNARVLNLGLGNQETNLNLEIRTPSNRGGNRMSIHQAEGISVPVKTLDHQFQQLNIPAVNLIKIDVEGFELKVLQGAEQVIKKFKPILFIELDDNNLKDQGDSAMELVSFISRQKYTQVLNAETGEKIDQNTNFSNCHYDIIARP